MKRILIVDDDPQILTLEERYLTNEGYDVVTAPDGQTALGVIESTTLDLVLLDVMMPGMDGFEVTERLRRTAANKRIPVIFVTARTDADALKHGFRSGGTMLLTKPFTRRQLLSTLRAAIPTTSSHEGQSH